MSEMEGDSKLNVDDVVAVSERSDETEVITVTQASSDELDGRDASSDTSLINLEGETTPELFEVTANESRIEDDSMEVSERPAQRKIFDFENIPMIVSSSFKEFNKVKGCNNFTKGCKWSPDGLCVLTNSDDNILRLFNSSLDSCINKDWDRIPTEMVTALTMKESGTIYDFCWYPQMNSTDPITCCLVSSCRHSPVHMWDAYTGEIRCTYKSYDHVEQLVSAISVAFSEHGQKLYCGFNKMIRIFDVCVPGRKCVERDLKNSNMGIVSCIAVSPTDQSLYAAGSYSRAVALYNASNGKEVFGLQGQSGGVTHIMFSPDGTKLYTGGRKDSEILCWDLRDPGEILMVLEREVSTNQRIYFDIDKSGRFIMSGNTNGYVRIWDEKSAASDDREDRFKPKIELCAHKDCVNGVSFNPIYPLIATCSGQRQFPEIGDNFSDDDEDIFTEKDVVDNSLLLWWAGPIEDDVSQENVE